MTRSLSFLVPGLLTAASLGAAEQLSQPTPPPSTGAQIGSAVGSGVEHALKSMRFGAYGDFHYNNFQGTTSHNGQGAATTNSDMIEMHRFVLMMEAQLSDRIGFVSELEFEHAFIQGGQGEVELEQSYIDYRYADTHSVRGGIMLVPISIGNLYHEPTTFHGVERSEFDRMIIPTTWYEGGLGFYGQFTTDLGYGVAVQAAPAADKYRSSDGLRSGRQKGFKSSADDLMATARLDYKPLPGLWLAAAGSYIQGDREYAVGVNVDSNVVLYTIEGRYDFSGWETGISWGQGFIDNADSHPNTLTSVNSPVPEVFQGLSAFVAYDVLRLVGDYKQKVFLFGRYENIDLQADIPNATSTGAPTQTDKKQQSQIYQIGVTWLLTENVVLKADYRDYDNEANTAVDSWNLGLGFAF
jgi:hypothetical protein